MAFELELGADLDNLLNGLRQATGALTQLRQSGRLANQDIQAGFTKTTADIQKLENEILSTSGAISEVARGIQAVGAAGDIEGATQAQERLNVEITATIGALQGVADAVTEDAQAFIRAKGGEVGILNQEIQRLQQLNQVIGQVGDPAKQQQGINLLIQQIQRVRELREETAQQPDATTAVENTTRAYQSLTSEIRRGTAELAIAQAQFGENSEEAQRLATHVATLQERLRNARETIQAFDPERRFNVIAQNVQGLVGAFTALQGAVTFLGIRSEAAIQQLAKIQGLLALSTGINQVLGLRNAFNNLLGVLGITTKGIDGTTKSWKQLTLALATNPFTIAIAGLSVLVALFVRSNEEQEEQTRKMRESARAAREHSLEIEKLRIAYREANGEISSVTASLELLNLEREDFEQGKLAEAQEKATDSFNSFGNVALRWLGMFGLINDESAKYNTLLKEETALVDDLIKKNNESIAQRQAEIRAREQQRLEGSIFQEQLRANELAARGDIELLRVRLQNVDAQLQRELKLVEGNETRKREILIRFANQRRELETQLQAAIVKRGEELLKAQQDLLTRTQQQQLQNLTGEERIRRERDIGLKEIEELRRNLQIKVRLNEEANKAISQQRLTQLLEVPEVIRTEDQRDEINRLINEVQLGEEQLAAINVLVLGLQKKFNIDIEKLQEERIATRISLIRDEEQKAIAEFTFQLSQREEAIRAALIEAGESEAAITAEIERIKREGIDAIKTKFRKEDLDAELQYQIDLINAKKAGANEEIKNETDRQLKLLELRRQFIFNESLNLDITTPEGQRQQAALDAQLREVEEKIAELKGELNKSKITWADIFNFEGTPEELAAFNSAMDFAIDRVKQLGLQILDSLQQANQLTIQQHEQQLSLIDDAIAQKESQIEQEEELNRRGVANNLDIRKQELAALKAQKEQERKELIKSYQEQQKLARARIILEGIETAAALVTAVANLFKSQSIFGPIGIAIAAGAAASMIGLFLSLKSKIQAASTPPQLGEEGGQINEGSLVSPRRIVRGRRHSHPTRGHRVEGTNIMVEDGEEFFSRKKVQQYDHLMEAMQRNDFSKVSIRQIAELPGITLNSKEIENFKESKQAVMNNQTVNAITMYTTGVEKRLDRVNDTLDAMRKDAAEKQQTWYMSDGTMIQKNGSTTTVIKRKADG